MGTMKKAYSMLVSAAGLLFGIFSFYMVYRQLKGSESAQGELLQLLIFFLLSYILRCFPIHLASGFSIDMAFISYFAILLSKGPYAAAVIILLGSIFVVVPAPGPKRKQMHILNTPIQKTLFANARLILSVSFGGLVFLWLGGRLGDFSAPLSIFPLLAMASVLILLNTAIQALLLHFNAELPFLHVWLRGLLRLLPSAAAAAPIGFYIAKVMAREYGVYLITLFVIPLVLARFSFTLYIDTKRNYYVMLKTLTYTLEAKDDYTRGHSERVERYAKALANEMHLSQAQIENLSVAALLHDIGKIGIDESILRKPSSLTWEERSAIQKHPEISVNILKEVKLPPIVFEIILHHHERYGGNGYPSGSAGECLPIEVFILSVADTYDAITSTRPYSAAKSPENARDIIISESGMQFNPRVVEAFVRAFEKGYLKPERPSKDYAFLS